MVPNEANIISMSKKQRVSLEEVVKTVDRMEASLSNAEDTSVAKAYHRYQALIPRFESDLGADSRDCAMARAGALMLVQELK